MPLVVSPFLHLWLLAATVLFPVFIVLPFPECHMNGVLQHVAS